MSKTLLECCLEEGGKWKLPDRPDSYFEVFARGQVSCIREYVGEARDPKSAEHWDLLRRDAVKISERMYWNPGDGVFIVREMDEEGGPLDMPSIERASAFYQYCVKIAPLFRHEGVGVVGDLKLIFRPDGEKFDWVNLPDERISPYAIRINSTKNADALLEELNKDVD